MEIQTLDTASKLEILFSDTNKLTRVTAKFWRYVNIAGENECWEWLGSLNEKGYGKISVGRKFELRAHRLSYSLSINKPMSSNLCVLHSCDNPMCVNPKHLSEGTHADNTKDCVNKGRNSPPPVSYGENHHNTKITNEEFQNIQNDNRKYKLIAKEYNLCEETVGRIKRNQTWK